MNNSNISKERVNKHIKKMMQSDHNDKFDAEYTSTLRTGEKVEGDWRSLVPRDSVLESYDPDTNGWCGYRCLYYGYVHRDTFTADRMGSTMRFLMQEVLEDQEPLFRSFFDDSFESVKNSLSIVPDSSMEWWLEYPDLVWVAVVTVKASIAVYTEYEGVVLFRFGDSVDWSSTCLLELKDNHFRCHVINKEPVRYNLHPMQEVFDLTFNK